jgi:hypothetical protein
MAALSWDFVRGVTPPTVIATLAATGITIGLLVWLTHRSEARTNARTNRMAANFAGEVRGLRDESECRWLAQRAWPARRTTLAQLVTPAEDRDDQGRPSR